jgi:hypothetical protein
MLIIEIIYLNILIMEGLCMKSLSLMFIFACTSMIFGVEAGPPGENGLGESLLTRKPSWMNPGWITTGKEAAEYTNKMKRENAWDRKMRLARAAEREARRPYRNIPEVPSTEVPMMQEPRTMVERAPLSSVRERVTPWAQSANARLSRWLGPREETAPLYTRAPRFSAADEEALTRAYENYVPPVNPPAHYFGPTTQQEFNRLPFDAERQALLQQPGVSKFEWLKGYLGVGSPVEAFRAWWNNRTPEQQYKKFKAEDLAAYEAAHKLAEQRQIAALQRQFEQLPFEKQLDLKRKDYEQLPWWKKAVTESPDAWFARQLRERSKSMPWPTPEERKIRSEEFRKKARLTPEGYPETEWWKIPQEG